MEKKFDYDTVIMSVAVQLGERLFHEYMSGSMLPSVSTEIEGAALALSEAYGLEYEDVSEQLYKYTHQQKDYKVGQHYKHIQENS